MQHTMHVYNAWSTLPEGSPSTSGRCHCPFTVASRHSSTGSRRSRHHTARDTRAWITADEFALWKGQPPMPKGWSPSVVPGARTVATPLLSPEKVLERLRTAVHDTAAEHFGAFYSSELGGIVTDPALMLIHMDDHMVHRGHGVFDTALITEGHLYQLPEHVRRFKKSAAAAGLHIPKSDQDLMRIILDTAAASRRFNGIVKFWVTSGRGGFGLSPRECTEPGLYVLATSETTEKMQKLDKTKGFKACTACVPPAGPPFSNIKSNNYLRNTMALMDAENRGFDVALFVDADGYVQEGPNMNVAILTQDDVLVTPPFDGCLAGVTIQRLMEIAVPASQKFPKEIAVRAVEQRPLKVSDILAAKEAFLAGSTLRVMPLVSIDEEKIADGKAGMTSIALDTVLEQDMQVGEFGTERHIQLPYGFLSGMKEQLA